MYKKLLFVLIIPLLVFSAELTHRYSFDNPTVQDGRVHLRGCRPAHQLFKPMIAVKTVQLLLPRRHEVVSLHASYDGLTTVKGTYDVKPFMPSISLKRGPYPDMATYKSPVYQRNEFFPQRTRSNWFNVQYKNGHAICVSSVNPVQYNPVTGQLRFFKNITVSIKTKPGKRAGTPYVCTPMVKSQLQRIIDNKDAVKNLSCTPKDADDYEYLIITYNDIKDNWNTFISFNERRGLRSKLETIQNIRSSVSGRDDADKIRNFIKKEYQDHKIVYVMLGSDVTNNANNIPYRPFRAYFYDCAVRPDRYFDQKDIAAEMYYSCLDGDWLTDQNGNVNQHYGEPGTEDVFFDVYTCRIPVASTTELNNVVNKTIKYSEAPVRNQVNNLFLAGNYLWTYNGVAVYGGHYMDEYLGKCSANNYTTYGFPTDKWNVEKLYDLTNNGWNVSDFRRIVNNHKPAWIEHEGHGNTTYAFEENNQGVTTSNYRNDGNNANFFVLTTGACHPGNFPSNDCLLEKFLFLKNGAVACQGFMDTGMEDDDSSDGVGQRVRRFFHDAIFNPSRRIHYLLMAHSNGVEGNAEIILNPSITTPPYFGAVRFVAYGLNFLGDPALSFWTDTPKDWTSLPQHTVDMNSFTMKTPPYTWVALCEPNGKILTTQLTGYVYDADESFNLADSSCFINDEVYKNYVKDHPGEKLKVRIKAHNYLPFEAEVDIPNTGIITNRSLPGLSFTNYSNSLGDLIRVDYTITNSDHVSLALYNSKGVLVRTLVNGFQQAGKYYINLKSSELNSGIYLCKLSSDIVRQTKRLIITK